MEKVIHFDLSGGFCLGGIVSALAALGGKPGVAGERGGEAAAVGAGITLPEEQSRAVGDALAALKSLGVAEVTRSRFPLPSGGDAEVTARLLAGCEVGGSFAPMDAAGVLFMLTAARFEDSPSFVLERAEGEAPRVFLGRRSREDKEALLVLEANIDDLSPEILALLIDCCIGAGALDAWLAPVLMKKGRPSNTLGALCRPEAAEEVRKAIFLNSSALGVRETRVSRTALERFWEVARTPWGEVRVKIARLDGKVVNRAPEFEDAAALSKNSGVPVKEIMAVALACDERSREKP
jgi:hypothetical protein